MHPKMDCGMDTGENGTYDLKTVAEYRPSNSELLDISTALLITTVILSIEIIGRPHGCKVGVWHRRYF
jgi:hypothetical protein